ncbi:MAG: hypothetical protein HOQ05_11685 [Corynebacteriales bacterium]|nr:hypothetical protein [Mycobacteriales bacterium]
MEQVETVERATAQRWWWLFLVTGALWLVIAMVMLRFNTTSIVTIGVLVGAMVLIAGFNEFFTASVVQSWRWAHLALGAVFVVVGTIAMFSPANTFWVLASLIGLFLVIKGAADIVFSVLTIDENRLWWLGLTLGILQIALGFWAHGGFGRQVILLFVWAAAAAAARGITEIIFAFQLRSGRGFGEDEAKRHHISVPTAGEYGKAA